MRAAGMVLHPRLASHRGTSSLASSLPPDVPELPGLAAAAGVCGPLAPALVLGLWYPSTPGARRLQDGHPTQAGAAACLPLAAAAGTAAAGSILAARGQLEVVPAVVCGRPASGSPADRVRCASTRSQVGFEPCRLLSRTTTRRSVVGVRKEGLSPAYVVPAHLPGPSGSAAVA